MREEEHQRRRQYEENQKEKREKNKQTVGYLGREKHLLDSSPPDLPNEVVLLPGLSSPSPHQHSAPVTTTHFPTAPFPSYPWSNHSHNPDWDSRDETIDRDNYQDLLRQAKQLQERAEFVKQQQEKEEHARQQQTNYNQFLQKAMQQQEREEYERLKNKEEQQLLQRAKQQQEREEYERFRNNITSVINKKITEHQYEEIPDAPAPDFHNHKLHVKMPDDIKPLAEKPSKQTKQPVFDRAQGNERHTLPNISLPPPDLHPSLGAASKVHKPPSDQLSGSPEWSGLTFCGPRFPSLEKDLVSDEDILPRIVGKKKIEVLRRLTEEQLREITVLEGNIHETIYNTRENQPPCSLLANQHIVSASQCPQLLPGNTQEKIKSMKEILELMEEKKQDHIETLQWLQKQPHHKITVLVNENDNGAWDTEEDDEATNDDDDDAVDDDDDNDNNNDAQEQHRASARLATKPKINYKRMDKFGKSNW